MTVNDLHKLLTQYIEDGRGDCTVEIKAMTGRLVSGSNVQVKDACPGFDWDMNKIIIYPEETLLGAQYAAKAFTPREKKEG